VGEVASVGTAGEDDGAVVVEARVVEVVDDSPGGFFLWILK
jgi:hypothetical protein